MWSNPKFPGTSDILLPRSESSVKSNFVPFTSTIAPICREKRFSQNTFGRLLKLLSYFEGMLFHKLKSQIRLFRKDEIHMAFALRDIVSIQPKQG